MSADPSSLDSPRKGEQVERMLHLLASAPAAHVMVFVDTEGFILGWCGGAESVFGYSEKEILGKNISLIFTSEDLILGLDALERRAAAQDGFSENDRWHVRKDGGRSWMFGLLTALRDENQELVGYAKVMTDRTDLRGQMETLANQVHAGEQLAQKRERFYARLSHEIRNSLAPLRSAVDLLRRDPEGSPREFTLGLLDRQLALLLRMTRDLQHGSPHEDIAENLSLHLFDLRDFMVNCMNAVTEAADRKSLALHHQLPDAPVNVEADPDRLHQVFYNLLDNAIKYTPEGGKISVRLSVEGRQAVVRINDNGQGISADLLPKVFDELSRDARHACLEGSGLGLSIVRDLVQAHGGTVEVRSEGDGKGSQFSVRLPLA
jgi:PAS domain S-box-containing protein